MDGDSTYQKLQNYLTMMDNSLQSYRMIFITSISILFLIAVSSLLFLKGWGKMFIWFLFLMNVIIIFFWRKVCTGKLYALLFFQILILKYEKNKKLIPKNSFIYYKTLIKDKEKDPISIWIENQKEYLLLNNDRIIPIMEIGLPWFYISLWCGLLIYTIFLK